jgi:uncharacterized DUF497 family protein
VALRFEWDAAKALANATKHGVGFEEASTVFSDPLSSTVPDPRHSQGEARFAILGESAEGRLLAVFFTERGTDIRIISAREATRRERDSYAHGTF